MAESSIEPSGSESQKRRALIFLLLGGASISCSPILVRASELGPITSAFWRVAFALIPLLIACRQRSRSNKNASELGTLRKFLYAGLPGFLLAGDLAAWHLSLHMTSVANATLLVNTSPIFVALASWLFLRQPISRNIVTGLVLAILGVVVLKGGVPSFSKGEMAGDAVALTAALFLSGYMIVMTRVRADYSTLAVMTASTVTTSLVLLPLALIFEEQFLPTSASGWLIVAAMGWICHVLGQGLIAYSLAWLPAAFSTLTLLIQPVLAAGLAWVLLNEPVGPLQIVGGFLVLTGILLARRS
ncbi:DMT family transporter [Planctomicrobium sp. SH527]|uniref:DMT family transporter n=1 Tax=Planctomicrobium sp. SH527 TaxID=3448123 RepID=UPI003F5CB8DC